MLRAVAVALRTHKPKKEKSHPCARGAERFCNFVPLSRIEGGHGHPCSLVPVATR